MTTGLALAALAFTLAACGPTGGGSTLPPTPTTAPTATPIPACAAWRVIPGPAGMRYPQSHLSGVAALSPTDAWAVGMNDPGEGSHLAASLIERWDGSTWRVAANPGAGYLNSVAAVSPQDVWAVGVEPSPISSAEYLMVEHWNGAQWSLVTVPIPGQTNSGFNAVVAQSANSVWAAGFYNGLGFSPQPVIERWDGLTWRVSTTALPKNASAASYSGLSAIPGSNQVWAAGSVRYGPPPSRGIGYFQPLIERWDGSAWQVVASPTLPSGALAGDLKGVVALSATDAWAVGNYTASDHTLRPLIVHWDGVSWTVSASPDEWGELYGVAAVGARDVSAVGYHMKNPEGSAQIGIIERWNGSAWSVSESPTPQGVTHSSLAAITADHAGGYWTAGYWPNADSVAQALIARCA